MGIVQTREPAATPLGDMGQLPPHDLHEQKFRQAGQHRAIARTWPQGFSDQLRGRRLPPARVLRERDRLGIALRLGECVEDDPAVVHADADERWHRVEKRTEPLVGMQVAANEARSLPVAAVLDPGDLLGRDLGEDARNRHGRHSGIAGHNVLVAARKHQDVAGLDPDRLELAAHDPAAGVRCQVKQRDRFRTRHEAGGEQVRRSCYDRPWPHELDIEMDRARNTDDAQNLGQDVHVASGPGTILAAMRSVSANNPSAPVIASNAIRAQ